MLSTTDHSYIRWVSGHTGQVLNLRSSADYPQNLNCQQVYDLRLPVLNYNHVLNCDFGFSRTFSPEYIESHRNFTSVDLGVKVVYALALNFGNLYGGFASSSLDQLKITQIFDGFIDKLFGTFKGSILDGIDAINPRFSHLMPKLERVRRAEARELELKQRQLRQEERKKDKRKKKKEKKNSA